MRSRWLDRVMVIGAFFVVAGIGTGLAVGWKALSPEDSTNNTKGNVFALVTDQDSGAGWGWVESDRTIDPAHEDNVVIRFWVTTATPDQASIVFGGPMVRYLRNCYGNGTNWDEKPVSFSTLSGGQQSAIITYRAFSPAQGLLDTYRGNEVLSLADAKAISVHQKYVRVTSSYSVVDLRSYTPGKTAPVPVTARSFNFACSFAPQAFWATKDGEQSFTFPTVIQAANFLSATNYLFVSRRATFIRSPEYALTALGDPPDYSSSKTTEFRADWQQWNNSGENYLELNQFVAIFKSKSEDSDHQAVLLVVGGALAFAGAIIVSLGESISDWFTYVIAHGLLPKRGASQH